MTPNFTMNLRVLLKDDSSHTFENVTEYVQGKQNFYILINDQSVHVFPTQDLKGVLRFNENYEWPINLKKWSDREKS